MRAGARHVSDCTPGRKRASRRRPWLLLLPIEVRRAQLCCGALIAGSVSRWRSSSIHPRRQSLIGGASRNRVSAGMCQWRCELSVDQCSDEWGELPILLKVDEAMRVLRIGRSKAYEMTTLYETSGGTQGLPCLRMGDLLWIPRFALEALVTTGRIVQLLPKPELDATTDAIAPRKSQRRTTDRSQLSLLASD